MLNNLSVSLRDLAESKTNNLNRGFRLRLGVLAYGDGYSVFDLVLYKDRMGTLHACIFAAHVDHEGIHSETEPADTILAVHDYPGFAACLDSIRFDSGFKPFVNRYNPLASAFPELF